MKVGPSSSPDQTLSSNGSRNMAAHTEKKKSLFLLKSFFFIKVVLEKKKGSALRESRQAGRAAPDGGNNHLNVLNSDASLVFMKTFPSIKPLQHRPARARTSPSQRPSAETLISSARRRSLMGRFAHRSGCALSVLLFFHPKKRDEERGRQCGLELRVS